MRGRMFKRVSAIALAGLMAAAILPAIDHMSDGRAGLIEVQAATPVRQTDVTQAAEGNVLVPIKGTFYRESAANILKRINEIRKEACDEGVINPGTGEKLTKTDYNPIKWSSALEKIAQTRAAEAAVVQGHTRPNGNSCFTCTFDGEQSWAEDLAWNYSGMMQGIEQWYSEKEDWVKQNANAVTGHYTSMINPSYNYVALGCFDTGTGDWISVSGEFSFRTGLDESEVGVSGPYIQMIEVPESEAKNYAEYAEKKDEQSKNSSTGNQTTTVKKKKNTIKIKVTSKTYKRSKLKKAKTFSIGVSKAKGKVTYSLNQAAQKAKIKVTAKGKVTVPKKCKKGTYKITVKAAGNKNYKAGSKNVTIKVK